MPCITGWSAQQRVLDPTKADLQLRVQLDASAAGMELRGRLIGPRCCYSSTIEVAYSLLTIAVDAEDSSIVCGRIIIPEPSLWDPESPFLYFGRLEIWEGGQRCDHLDFTLGLRSLRLGPRGILLNGRSYFLRGTKTIPRDKEEAESVRSAGLNTLLIPVEDPMTDYWHLADERGFFVLGLVTYDSYSSGLLEAVARHPCCLGVLLSEPSQNTTAGAEFFRQARLQQIALIGAEIADATLTAIPEQCNFVAGTEAALNQIPALPRLLIVDSERPVAATDNPPVLGWIRQ